MVLLLKFKNSKIPKQKETPPCKSQKKQRKYLTNITFRHVRWRGRKRNSLMLTSKFISSMNFLITFPTQRRLISTTQNLSLSSFTHVALNLHLFFLFQSKPNSIFSFHTPKFQTLSSNQQKNSQKLQIDEERENKRKGFGVPTYRGRGFKKWGYFLGHEVCVHVATIG